MTAFVHLNLHTEFSLVDSTVRIPQLMQRCRDNGMPIIVFDGTRPGNILKAVMGEPIGTVVAEQERS